MNHSRRSAAFGLIIIVSIALSAAAGDGDAVQFMGVTYPSWSTYVQSEAFQAFGMRCGTPDSSFHPEVQLDAPGDCSMAITNPDPSYAPGPIYEIPVVVHIITAADGVTGDLSDALVQSQIDVLNEDYLAIAGTAGGGGTYTGVRWVLAATDPHGDPTTGITRTANASWFNDNDEQGFKTALMWDPHRYLNFYTNNTQYLGYSWFPQWGVGGWQDGIVINYQAFGRPSTMPPYHLGRTATHEVGHWVGLLHTFEGGCGNPDQPYCYSTADKICDTEPDATSHFYCTPGTSCGSYPIPIENYMEYTNDACMTRFSEEQMLRLRCAITSYRPNVYTLIDTTLFSDGFESGDWSTWSAAAP
ncbi:MAG TPA: zinc metalloprotease [Thermoanaerobaculales bacterium]|nr:zinc metalloprotease [Thermoanaerobaculales bacterium]HPA81842.1 zinc metalloprotease [Thermoanaerobaculales bacterium]HQN97678.1 zinc metalloprotease [Thermoanaerobaculales bacterium]